MTSMMTKMLREQPATRTVHEGMIVALPGDSTRWQVVKSAGHGHRLSMVGNRDKFRSLPAGWKVEPFDAR